MLRCREQSLVCGHSASMNAGCMNAQTLARSSRLRCLHDSGPAKALQSNLPLVLRQTVTVWRGCLLVADRPPALLGGTTSCGWLADLACPRPSCPNLPKPQVYSLLLAVSAAVWRAPQLTCGSAGQPGQCYLWFSTDGTS